MGKFTQKEAVSRQIRKSLGNIPCCSPSDLWDSVVEFIVVALVQTRLYTSKIF